MCELTPKDFPKDLTNSDYEKLADLFLKNPISETWREISAKLLPEQKALINRKVDNRKYSVPKLGSSSQLSMSDSTWEKEKKSIEENKFYENMGRPENPEEFKNKQGKLPPENELEDNE